MSLWGKKEAVALTGTITVTNANSTIVGVGTQFSTQLNVGDTISFTSNSVVKKLVVASIVSNTQITVKPTPNTQFVAAAVAASVNDVPKYVPVQDAINNVEKITTADASNTDFKDIGIKTPGWVKSTTYVDAIGRTRHKTETLVVFKS